MINQIMELRRMANHYKAKKDLRKALDEHRPVNYPASNPYTGAGVKKSTWNDVLSFHFPDNKYDGSCGADSVMVSAVEECMQKGFSQCHVDINGKRLSLLITDGEGMGAEA